MSIIIIIIIILYIYHALINALSAHMIHTNLNMIFTTHVSYSCVCARARACVSWRRGWGLGGMELRVGSNLMIHFLYILLLLIWHMYLYIIHC